MVRRLRPLAFVLTLVVSPLWVAVCEVVCSTPVHVAGHDGAHGAAPVPPEAVDAHVHHAQHAHHAPPAAMSHAPVSSADGVMSLPGPECEPLFGIPARVRSTFSAPDLQAGAVAQVVTAIDMAAAVPQRPVGPDLGPPVPPRHAPTPLRI